MSFITQTSLGPNPSNLVADVNTIIRKIQIEAGASMQILNNGGAMRIVSPINSSVQGMIIVAGSQVKILGV